MTKVVFSPEAKRDLVQIGDYIAFSLHNKSSAKKLISKIQKTVRILQKFPESGTPLDYAGPHILYRYLICDNYMIFYHLSDDQACVDRVLYEHRDYLAILFGDQLKDEENE